MPPVEASEVRLAKFAEAMRVLLMSPDSVEAADWRTSRPTELADLMHREASFLRAQVWSVRDRAGEAASEILAKAADVANLCMMLADCVESKPTPEPPIER